MTNPTAAMIVIGDEILSSTIKKLDQYIVN